MASTSLAAHLRRSRQLENPRLTEASSLCADLRMTILTATFEAEENCQLPEYKGSTLRGAFGHSLVAISGHSSDGDCTLCKRQHCAYGYIFEGHSSVNGRNPILPLVIDPPEDTRQQYWAGEQITMKLTLIGDAVSWVPTVVWALGRMGWKGLGFSKAPWTLVEVQAQTPTGKAISLLDNFEAVPTITASDIVKAWPVFDACELQFQTPLCINRKGEMLQKLDAVTLIQRINGRLADLQTAFCNGTPDVSYLKKLNGLAEQIHIDTQDVKRANWKRFSSKSSQLHTVKGITGRMQLSNIPPALSSLLVLGQFFHIGKSAAFGMGSYTLIPH